MMLCHCGFSYGPVCVFVYMFECACVHMFVSVTPQCCIKWLRLSGRLWAKTRHEWQRPVCISPACMSGTAEFNVGIYSFPWTTGIFQYSGYYLANFKKLLVLLWFPNCHCSTTVIISQHSFYEMAYFHRRQKHLKSLWTREKNLQ